jgi:hypothetical protein
MRVAKWTVTSVLTIIVFGVALWVGALVNDRVLPSGWPDASKITTVIAFASLLATTIVFGIGKWWAERDAKPVPAAAQLNQVIAGAFGGSGDFTGCNIAGDVNIGRDPGRTSDGGHHG